MNHSEYRTQYIVTIAPTLYMILVALLLSVKDSSERETLRNIQASEIVCQDINN